MENVAPTDLNRTRLYMGRLLLLEFNRSRARVFPRKATRIIHRENETVTHAGSTARRAKHNRPHFEDAHNEETIREINIHTYS